MGLEKLDDAGFEEKVLHAKGKACVEFYADWCGWCKRQEKVSEQIVAQDDGVPIYLVNGDENPAIVEELGIRGYPTYVLFEDGKKKDVLVGAAPAAQVKSFLAG